MESRDNVRERFAVLAEQMPAMKAQIRTVEGRRRGGRLTWPVAAVIALGLALALPHPAQAKTLRCGAGDVGCLIAAINEANTNGQRRNTIRLEAGTYTLTAFDNDTDGPNGLPSVTSTLTIRGAGAETTIIERDASAPSFRLLHVADPGTLTVDALTLQGGNASGPPGGPGSGGGIFSSGTLTVTQCTFRENTATGGGPSDMGLKGSGRGGGISSSGTLTVAHSTLSDNTAASVNGMGLRGSGDGGGIFSSGTLIVTHSSLSNNRAVGGFNPFGETSGSGSGGGIFSSSTLTVTHSTLIGNTASGARVGGFGSGGGIFSSSTLTVTNSTLSGNTAMGAGGPIGHAIGVGGGISSSGTLTVTRSTLSDNTAASTGFDGPPASGGGIYFSSSSGTLTVTNSTLSGNTAAGEGGTGGGIFSIGTLTVTNSTLSGNTAISVRGGGGLANLFGGSVALQNTILAQNSGAGTAPDCAGLITSLGTNLIGDPTGCTITLQPGDLTGDSGLGTFTDNSRPGNGHFPLLPTSQAIDAGSDTVCPRRDQLGQRRIGPCDIGAIRFRDKDDRRHDEEDGPHEGTPESVTPGRVRSHSTARWQ